MLWWQNPKLNTAYIIVINPVHILKLVSLRSILTLFGVQSDIFPEGVCIRQISWYACYALNRSELQLLVKVVISE